MKRKTMIAVVISGLLVLFGILTATRSPERGISRLDFSQVDVEAIDKVVLSGANTAELVKDGEDWLLGGKLAEERSVKQLVEGIAKINSSDLVTKSAARYADFEVDDEKGTDVKVYAHNALVAELRVGKASKGGAHIRVGDDVFAVAGIYPRNFAKNGNDWLEKKLFKEKINEIGSVEVQLAGEPAYKLVKQDNKWALEDPSLLPAGFRFDESAASRLVSSLVNLRAKDILEEDPGAEKTKLDKEFDRLTFTTAAPEPKAGEKDGEEPASAAPPVTREVRLGGTDTENKTVYVQVQGRAEVMTLHESTVKNLRKKPTEFRDLKIVELDKDKVMALAIVADGKTLTFEKKGSDWSIGKSTEKVPGDFTLDPAAVTRRLSSMANTRGTAVAEVNGAAAGLSRPSAKVTATLDDGATVTLAFGKEIKHDDREEVFARGNADDAVYYVNKYTQTSLTGLLDTFKKRDMPAGGSPSGFGNLDPSALKNLPPDVRRSLEDQMRKEKQQQKLLKRLQSQSPEQ